MASPLIRALGRAAGRGNKRQVLADLEEMIEVGATRGPAGRWNARLKFEALKELDPAAAARLSRRNPGLFDDDAAGAAALVGPRRPSPLGGAEEPF